ncbi:hypothetical protein Tco_1415158 [Tanacetum coccineum]
MIDQGCIGSSDAWRTATGEDHHDSGTSGTEGGHPVTKWFERMETVFRISNCSHDVAHAMTLKNLEKIDDPKSLPIMAGRLRRLEAGCGILSLKGCFLKRFGTIEKYVSGLPDMIHGSVMASKPKTMQDAIEFATELMDKKIRTFVE